jgi:ubiquinone/menaquinone biosynthesis C-methylase UbiE
MLVFLVILVIVILALIMLSVIRLNIPRDPSLELPDDAESIRDYETVSNSPLFTFLRFLEISHLSKYQPHGTLMDAGCGPGHIDLALARKYPDLKIIGIDTSHDMIDLANSLKRQSILKAQIAFQLDDIQNLSLRDNSVDFVISSLSLHHWPDPKPALQECYRVLKPQGQLLFFDLRRDQPLSVYWTILVAQKFIAPAGIRRTNGGGGSVWSAYTPSEMESLLKASFTHYRVDRGWAWAYLWAQKLV